MFRLDMAVYAVLFSSSVFCTQNGMAAPPVSAAEISQSAGPLYLVREEALGELSHVYSWLGSEGVLPAGVNEHIGLWNQAIVDYVKFQTMKRAYRTAADIWNEKDLSPNFKNEQLQTINKIGDTVTTRSLENGQMRLVRGDPYGYVELITQEILNTPFAVEFGEGGSKAYDHQLLENFSRFIPALNFFSPKILDAFDWQLRSRHSNSGKPVLLSHQLANLSKAEAQNLFLDVQTTFRVENNPWAGQHLSWGIYYSHDNLPNRGLGGIVKGIHDAREKNDTPGFWQKLKADVSKLVKRPESKSSATPLRVGETLTPEVGQAHRMPESEFLEKVWVPPGMKRVFLEGLSQYAAGVRDHAVKAGMTPEEALRKYPDANLEYIESILDDTPPNVENVLRYFKKRPHGGACALSMTRPQPPND